jgi:hypothetical protein
MRDYLLDLVQHTYGLGVIELLKVSGTAQKTQMQSYDNKSKTLIMRLEFKNPIAEFIGNFGMAKLNKLQTLLNIPEYVEDAQITVESKKAADGTKIPDRIEFVNKDGDFKNTYRFMPSSIADGIIGNISEKQKLNFKVEVAPTVASIQRFRFQSSANSDAELFSVTTENGQLLFHFGNEDDTGTFVFSNQIGTGKLSKQNFWPVALFNSVMSLSGDKTLKIADEGLMRIQVDSGLAVYTYDMLAKAK